VLQTEEEREGGSSVICCGGRSAFQAKGALDEQHLSDHIAFQPPPHLTFPNHVDYFVAWDGSACALKGTEALLGRMRRFTAR
jgi:hypothetical protein